MTREEIDRLLDDQIVGRLGVRDGDDVYVVPLIFARRGDALYVMGGEGRKTRAARGMTRVCFEVDEHDRATGSWRSAIVWGRYEELVGAARDEALAILMARLGARRPSRGASDDSSASAPAKEEHPTVAFRIAIDEVTGRAVKR